MLQFVSRALRRARATPFWRDPHLALRVLEARASMRRVAPRWLLAAIALGVCLCVMAATTRASKCDRTRTLLERATPAALAGSHAADASPAPTDPGVPGALPEPAAVDAKTCPSVALVAPARASTEPRFTELAAIGWPPASTVARATSSGIERPPRRA